MIELDPLDRDRLRVDPEAESERSEDCELVRGIEAADVEGRIGFGVAETLGLGEADVEREVVGLHARQDVVAGAVEDAGDALDRVAGEALAQCLDDRNAAADRSLEKERRIVRFGQRREPHPMRGEHRLVGGDHRQPARQRRLDSVEGDAVRPADQFDEDVDIGGRGHRGGVVEEMRAAEIDAAIAVLSRAKGGEDAFAARARDEASALPLEQLNEARPDDANAGDAQAQRFCHHVLAPLSGNRNPPVLVPESRPRINEAPMVQP